MFKAITVTLAAVALYATVPVEATNGNTGPARWEGAVVTVSGAPVETYAGWETDSLRLAPVETGGDITIVRGAMPDNSMGRVGAFAEPVIVDGWIVSCTITIDDSVTPGILTHEIGHCLGMEHVTGKHANESIMNPWENPDNTTVMPLDRKLITRLY